MRFYKLDSVPNGFREDETSIGYNAYSVLQTGKDEHGAFLPQNFKAFGEYKLPGYIYASVIPIKIFGLNPIGIRFIAAMSGFLTVVVTFFLTKALLLYFENDKEESIPISYLPYLTTFLIAVNPWSLHFSRSAFESTLANFLIVFGVFLFVKAVQSKRTAIMSLSVISFALSMYTYNIARLFVPLLVIALIFIFRKNAAKYSKINYIQLGLIISVCAIPFAIGALKHGGADSTLGTLIFSSAKVQAGLQEFRSYFIQIPFSKILFNYFTLTLWQYINNVFAHFSAAFYFISGPTDGSTSLGLNGQWYIFELPLFIWGLVWLTKAKNVTTKIILCWIILLIMVSSITREPPQATRTFSLTYPITFLSSAGLYALLGQISKLRNIRLKYLSFFVTSTVIFYYIAFYLISYYVRFPIFYAKAWRTADRDASYFINQNQNNYSHIIIDSQSGIAYSSLLVYLAYPPAVFQSEVKWHPEDSEGFTYPESFGKFEMRKIDWSKDLNLQNTLIMTSFDKKPPAVGILKTINYPQRPVVINSGQKILRFPFSDPAYIFIETKK